MYIINHKANKNAYIKTCKFPPRLCEWTDIKDDAQLFEFEREVKDAVEFIKKTAFNVEYKEI